MISINKIFSSIFILLTFVSVNQWSRFPIGNTFFTWGISFIVIAIVLRYKQRFFYVTNKSDYQILLVYFIWLIISVIRGAFVAENYWEWKQLIDGGLSLSLPVFIYCFSNPKILSYVLRNWLRFALPAFFIFFTWVTTNGSKHQYLGPILLLSCFLPIIPTRKWKYLFLGFLLFMMTADLGARSQVIKAVLAILMSVGYVVSKYISAVFLKISCWILFITPVLLLFLGLTGQFNVFKGLEESQGGYVEEKIVNGEVRTENLSQDTRTEIYVEIITSAINNNYVLWGRTPARGNDSELFASFAKSAGLDKNERHRNEIGLTNVFTWLGLIGLLPYCFIYFKSAYLGMNKSNNIFSKLIAVYIAFRFAYGWVEDVGEFRISSISLWMLISMGFSESFRRMTDNDFKIWVKSIFKNI